MIRKLPVLLLLLVAFNVKGQETDSTKNSWEVEANAILNFIPSDFYVMPVIRADKGRLHLETGIIMKTETLLLFGVDTTFHWARRNSHWKQPQYLVW